METSHARRIIGYLLSVGFVMTALATPKK